MFKTGLRTGLGKISLMWPDSLHDNSPSTFVTQPRHFAITYLCLYPYTKKPFMRKSRVYLLFILFLQLFMQASVPSIESCAHMPSEELVKRFVWRSSKYSPFNRECHILSLTSQICDTTRATRK